MTTYFPKIGDDSSQQYACSHKQNNHKKIRAFKIHIKEITHHSINTSGKESNRPAQL